MGLNTDDPTKDTFLDSNLSDVFRQQAGQDVTPQLNMQLWIHRRLKNVFYVGELDFRKTARCQVQNIMLIIFSAILMASMGLKRMFSSL
jgi:chitin synthase